MGGSLLNLDAEALAIELDHSVQQGARASEMDHGLQ